MPPDSRPGLMPMAHNYKLVRHAEHEVKRLEALNGIYTLGGGRNCGKFPCQYLHGLPDGRVGDCSWFMLLICRLLHVNVKDWLGWTGTLQAEGHAGPGKLFTIHIKQPFETEGHTIGQFHHPMKDRWVQCGGRDNPQANGGVTFWTPTKERIAEFPIKRHFAGF